MPKTQYECSAHGEPDICDAPHKKPMEIYFYNSQRSVDIINRMLCDYSCQPTRNSWVVVVFTLILYLAVVNVRPILKYNKRKLFWFIFCLTKQICFCSTKQIYLDLKIKRNNKIIQYKKVLSTNAPK